ncbi:MAG TPA: hypothetical protein VHU23_00230 [Rhizomicrobium sp.]|nr:hypothetical protein [Rhizomicrobium sp.]
MKLEGEIAGIQDGAIVGWAWNPERPYEAVDVELYVEDVCLAKGSANNFDIDLAKANRGNGMHRFQMRLDRLPPKPPPFLIRAVVAGTDVELHPPVPIATLTEAERLLSGNDYVGEVTGIANGTISGWVLNRRNPHEAPAITLRDGERDVVTLTPSERVTRILDSGVTAAAFRFDLALPQTFLDGKLHPLTILVGGSGGRTLGAPLLFGPSDISSVARMLVSISDRLDQMERRIEALKPAWDFPQFEKRVTARVVEPVDMLLSVHRDSVEMELAVVRRQITEIMRHIPDLDQDLLAPSASVPAIHDVEVPEPAVFDPIDRSRPMATFDLSAQSPDVQCYGDIRWAAAGGEPGFVLIGNGTIEVNVTVGDDADVVIRGSGAHDASELSAIVVAFNGRPMSGRFDVFADGFWVFLGSAIEGAADAAPARPTIAFNYLSGIARPSGRLRLNEISFFAPGRGPSRIEANVPTAAIVNLGREASSAGWHPVEAGGRGGICWMGELSDVSVNLSPTGSYHVSIPEIRPLVADLIPKLQMFLDGEPVNFEISPTAQDPSAYSAHGLCQLPNGSHETRTLRISFPKEDVKSPMELGLNPDLRPLTIAVRCIMVSAATS